MKPELDLKNYTKSRISKSRYYPIGKVEIINGNIIHPPKIRVSDHPAPTKGSDFGRGNVGSLDSYIEDTYLGVEFWRSEYWDDIVIPNKTFINFRKIKDFVFANFIKSYDLGESSMISKLIKLTEKAMDTPNPYLNKNFWKWFKNSKIVDSEGNPLVVYHGTKRPDRIGTEFRKDRATSGRMSFFTDDPEVASNYAKDKQDTSLYDVTFEDNIKIKGVSCSDDFKSAERKLNQKERWRIYRDGYKFKYKETKDETGRLLEFDPADEESILDKNTWHHFIQREGKGNVLKALYYFLYQSYGDLEPIEFVYGLKDLGIKVEYDSPLAEYPAVIGVYLSIQNPLYTNNIPSEVIERLKEVSETDEAQPKYPSSHGADFWDKRTRDPQVWIDALIEDQEKGTYLAWTSIPDWVSDALESMGYDGIVDTGGKMGGMGHMVVVPFEPYQIKSAYGNKGKFNPKKSSIIEGMN